MINMISPISLQAAYSAMHGVPPAFGKRIKPISGNIYYTVREFFIFIDAVKGGIHSFFSR